MTGVQTCALPISAGMAGAYINRYGIPYVDADGSQADLEVPGLAELADQLTQT